jgi:hypothetical protein
MALAESDRRDIFDSLEAVHGQNVANNLMQLIPHQPAAQLVTREDMHANTQMLRGEMAELRGEMRGEMAEFRAEMRSEIAALSASVDTRLADLQVNTQRLFAGAIAANIIGVVTALVS